MTMKKILIAILALSTFFCFVACGNNSNSITCPECGYENASGVKFCSDCGAAMTTSNDDNQNNNNENIDNNQNDQNDQNDDNKNKVSVSNSSEFLNKIADDTKLSLSADVFDFDGTFSINNTLVQKNTDSGSYTISGVENLVIEGESTTILISAKSFELGGLLSFDNCQNVVFKKIVFKTVTKNDDDWYLALAFSNCQNIKFEDCSFENLSLSIDVSKTTDFSLNDCKFKDLDYTAIGLWDVKNVLVNNCTFKNTGDVFHSTRSSVLVKGSVFEDINDSSIFCDDLYDYTTNSTTTESEATFENCTFKNNSVLDFFNKSTLNGDYNFTYEYNHNKIKFKNCSFTNNSYYNGNLDSSNYIDCSFSNNNKEINWTEEDIQNIIQIHDIYVDDIDSAEGVDMRISWTNTSDKTIKYVHFYVVPYNAVGDPMYCEIRDYSRFDAYVTGPCEPGYEGYYKIGDIYYGNLWEDVWYNGSISTIELVGIKIIYMDGSVIDMAEKDVYKTFVAFSPLKEGYGIDEAFLEYYPDDSRHRFYWALEYLGIPVRPNVNIDVRIVNSNNVEVFSCGYYAKSEDFTEINMSGVNKWLIATSIRDDEIKVGNSSTGTLYYHIWSDDGTIDLGERSIEIDNLPTN